MVFPTFAAYAATFDEVYNGDEAAHREGVYNKAIAAMESHDADMTQTYQQGINQFSDLTPEQFKALPIRGYMASAKAGLPKVWYTSLSSSWMIALSRTVAATMVSWTTRSHSAGPRPFPLSPRTHTLPVMAPIFPR